jgi:phosphoserine phosphatase
MKNNKFKAIVFDIDETLTDFVSWISLTQDLGESIEKHSKIYSDLVSNMISLVEAEKAIISNWNNSKPLTKETITSIISKWKYRDHALKMIQKLKKEYIVVFISGAIQPFYDKVCQEFGITQRYNLNEFHYKKNILSRIKYTPVKKNAFRKFLNNNSLKANQVVVVGDGDNDIDMFTKAGYSFLFSKSNNSHLEKYCDKVIKSFKELELLL